MNEIPGIISDPPKVEAKKPELPYNRTFPYDGHFYHAQIGAGKVLSWHNEDGYLTSMPIPKKVLKKALKEWRKLNPPRDRFEFPRLRCNHTFEKLGLWLLEKSRQAQEAK